MRQRNGPQALAKDDPQHAPGGGTTASSREGGQHAARAYRAYHRWLRLKRMAMVAFAAVATIFLFWAIPWLPSGLDVSDYTPELAFTTYLLGSVVLMAAFAMICQELARRQREGIIAWGSVFDEATGLHNRDYLFDRLDLECERAARAGAVFSVLVLRVQLEEEPAVLGRVAEVIEGVTHRSDVIALLSDAELAVLSPGVAESDRGAVVGRIVEAITHELGRSTELVAGAATYGVEGDSAGALVQAARTAGQRTRPQRLRAA